LELFKFVEANFQIMKTTFSNLYVSIFSLLLVSFYACKKDEIPSTITSNNSNIIQAQSCLITKVSSDYIRYNPDSSVSAYGYLLFKRFGDTLYTQLLGFPYGYVVYDKLNRPEQIRFNSDTSSKKVFKYVGTSNKISSVELYAYSIDSLNQNRLSYYYKLTFTYVGDIITNANYEFLNLSKDIALTKGTFEYKYLNKYTDSRVLTMQKLLSPIIFDSNPIKEISQYSIYPVSSVKDSQNKFSSTFAYEFDSNGKITKEIIRENFYIVSETTYSYTCK